MYTAENLFHFNFSIHVTMIQEMHIRWFYLERMTQKET